MAKKGNRIQVILECTEHKASGLPGTSRYITTKNKKNTPDRLEIKKFNPIMKKVNNKIVSNTRFTEKLSIVYV
jgi:large subunit ribosomal protein L33